MALSALTDIGVVSPVDDRFKKASLLCSMSGVHTHTSAAVCRHMGTLRRAHPHSYPTMSSLCSHHTVVLQVQIALPVEPSFCAVGSYFAAAGLNNQAWLYSLGDNGRSEQIAQRTYFGNVDAFAINDEYVHIFLPHRPVQGSGGPGSCLAQSFGIFIGVSMFACLDMCGRCCSYVQMCVCRLREQSLAHP